MLVRGKGLSRLSKGVGIMSDNDNVRYWNRVGMYITREFAEEWIEKLGSSDTRTGRYLDDDIEEYIDSPIPSPGSLKREVNNLFEEPFKEVDLPNDIKAIVVAEEMQRNRISRIKELKAEGYSLEESKEMFQQEMDEAVCEILGVDVGSMSIGMGQEAEEEESDSEASEDDESSE